MRKLFKILKIVLLLFPYLLIGLYLIYPHAYTIFHGVRIETAPDMEEQVKVSPQEISTFFSDSASMRPAPPHSVPVGKQKYRFEQAEYDSAKSFVNPLPKNEFVLARGRNRFEIFCFPCHNVDGKGNGLIVTKPILSEDEEGFPPPADLTSERTKSLSDGRLYHILSAGQNLMFSVDFKMNETDKWAIIYYIRQLQNKK